MKLPNFHVLLLLRYTGVKYDLGCEPAIFTIRIRIQQCQKVLDLDTDPDPASDERLGSHLPKNLFKIDSDICMTFNNIKIVLKNLITFF